MNKKDEAPKTERSILIQSMGPGAPTLIDLKWYFENPHQAGHIVGQLLKTLVRAFQESNPQAPRHEILTDLLGGASCKLSEGFLDGDDGDVIKTH